jgi:glucose-6-phosphate-specific signal transduction histidine kinase
MKMHKNKNNRGQMIMINLLFLIMTIAVLISLIPALNSLLNIAQQSDSLNCNGYMYNGNSTHPLSYNASLPSNDLSCLAIKLFLPYIVLAVLIGSVSRVIASRMEIGAI